jgi:transposase-like protein
LKKPRFIGKLLCHHNKKEQPMNLAKIFCPNPECPARGKCDEGNITVHSQAEKRCACDVCETTFSITKGTIFYRLKTDPMQVMLVITLLAYGCPVQAIVVAFGFDERTVRNWWKRAGGHCQAVHEHKVEKSQLDVGQVQADEIKANVQGGSIWMAMAMMVSTRLWLGGVISPHRDKELIQQLADKVRGLALCRPLLIAVDGLPSYVTAFRKAFRSKLPRYGKQGRAKLRAWTEVHLVQVVKQRGQGGLTISRRIVQGAAEQIAQLIRTTQGHGGINTAYIERLNATFRQRLNCLARRTRTLVRQPQTLQAGMYVVGCLYNFCTYHQSLRVPYFLTGHSRRWLPRTPAIAAGLTDHRWSIEELFWFKVPPEPWTPPKRRGRPSNEMKRLIERWVS